MEEEPGVDRQLAEHVERYGRQRPRRNLPPAKDRPSHSERDGQRHASAGQQDGRQPRRAEPPCQTTQYNKSQPDSDQQRQRRYAQIDGHRHQRPRSPPQRGPKQPGNLPERRAKVAVLPARALRVEGAIRLRHRAAHTRLGAKQRQMALQRQVDSQLHIFHQIAAGRVRLLHQRPRNCHAGAGHPAGRAQSDQPQGPDQVGHAVSKNRHGFDRAVGRTAVGKVPRLHGPPLSPSAMGKEVYRPRLRQAVGVDHHHHVRRIVGQMAETSLQCVPFAAPAWIVSFDHLGTRPAGQFGRPIGAVVGHHQDAIGGGKHGNDCLQSMLDDELFVVSRDQHGRARFVGGVFGRCISVEWGCASLDPPYSPPTTRPQCRQTFEAKRPDRQQRRGGGQQHHRVNRLKDRHRHYRCLKLLDSISRRTIRPGFSNGRRKGDCRVQS